MPKNKNFLIDKYSFAPNTKNSSLNILEFYENIYAILAEKTKENATPKADYPIFDINFKQRIFNLINSNNLPAEFKEKMDILIQTTENNNLVLCSQNIKNLAIQKKHFNKLQILFKRDKSIGSYNSEENKIIYYTNYIDMALGHEILHMASSIPNDKYCSSGFKYSLFFTGLNEGYTELLNRRKFFNEDFQTSCYKTSVFILRILELLLPNKEQLEDAYFHNDTNFVYNSFCTYSSKQEFFIIMKYLDLFCEDMDNIIGHDQKILNLAYEIVTRTHNADKIKQAKDFTDEYFDTTKVKRKRLY